MNRKTHIVVHHSLTDDGDTLSWPVIRRIHTAQGMIDIAYHIGFEWLKRDQTEGHYEAMLGRPLLDKAAGAWQQSMNSRGVHVLFVGNYDLTEPGDGLLLFAGRHIAAICDVLDIEASAEFVIPHRQVASYKSCPGKLFPMDRLIECIRGVTR